jgi:hypothetical protein
MRALHGYLDNTPRESWDYRLIARIADIISAPPSDDWYSSIFALAPSDRICGEATPEYSILPPEGVQHILRLAPRVKIILMLRDPIERNWSQIRMNTPANAGVEDLKRSAQYGDVISRSDYPKIISLWSEFVAPERFKIVFMDDVIAQPRIAMASICAFLGIEYDDRVFNKLDKPVHVGEARPIPQEVMDLLKTQLLPIYDKMCEMFPAMGKKWRERHYGPALADPVASIGEGAITEGKSSR